MLNDGSGLTEITEIKGALRPSIEAVEASRPLVAPDFCILVARVEASLASPVTQEVLELDSLGCHYEEMA